MMAALLGRRSILPFPQPLRVGTDVCQVSRVYRILTSGGPARRRGARFVERLLAPREREPARLRAEVAWLLSSSSSPGREGQGRLAASTAIPGREKEQEQGQGVVMVAGGRRDARVWKAAEFLAGRFAAKEAAIKAHPHRTLTFHDVEITRREDTGVEPSAGGAPPVAIIRGLEDRGVPDQEALVSISHDGDYATAVCIGFDARGSG